METCPICGENHPGDTHGEAVTILQPSLHTPLEFTEMVLDECDCRAVNVVSQRTDLAKYPEFENDVLWEAIAALQDAGYPTMLAEDTFLIYEKE